MAADQLLTQTLNYKVAMQLVDACLRQGVDHFFLAPGSRCTPLTVAIANRPEAHVVQHVDERGLTFACLGFGRATGRPGAFVCTSGTAVANALPAVIEASLDNVPLLLLTADRPPELRSTGANQAIDQCKIFGQYVRWFFDVPCPAPEFATNFWESTVRFAAASAASGPVHLNCMFREPFGACNPSSETTTPPAATEPQLNVTCQWQVPRGRTLVVAGGCRYHEALAANRLADRLGCPFLADVTTGIRSLSYDLQLFRDDNPPADIVLHVGGTIVSKRWWQFIDAHPPSHYLHLTPYSRRLDPVHRVTHVMRGPLEPLCEGAEFDERSPTDFLEAWTSRSQLSRRIADMLIDAQQTINEPAVARAIAAEIPNDGGLLLGNSLPIRHMDQFGHWPAGWRVHVAANRGASGIDGLVATSVGFATGLRRHTTALIGDLSALHDLNSLAMLAASTAPVIAVVLNNDGGGLFHFLPVASETSVFERYFATPHGRTFTDTARMFDLAYDRPATMQQFVASYRQATIRPQSSFIEVRTDRRQNRQLHREIEQAVRGTPQ
jgi:2-succinyl-5-enolpyruvyl-6-hydroxy-3-cyclohexene-1-carboxylate synthase